MTPLTLFFGAILTIFLLCVIGFVSAHIYMDLFNFKVKRHRHFVNKCKHTLIMIRESSHLDDLYACQSQFRTMVTPSEKARKDNEQMIMQIERQFQLKALMLTGDFTEAERYARRFEGSEILSKIKGL